MLPSAPILIVDDEEDLRRLLQVNLEREGFAIRVASSGREALALLEAEPISLVILDLMLPDLRGTEICRRIRTNSGTAELPVIMLTARGEEIDRVVGFEVGADDYVVKSDFSMRELVLRVRAVLRRRGTAPTAPPEEALVHGGLTVDRDGHRVLVDGDEVALTPTEFRLLCALADAPGRVQTRSHLLQVVWDAPGSLDTRTVDTHVKRLREKLGPLAPTIVTVRGVGYRFEPGEA